MNSYNTTAYIDLTALRNNVQIIKKLAPNSSILAMVKRNAYGHGSVQIAKAIQAQVNAFGVACLNEALTLYNAGIDKPILLLKGFYTIDELKIIDKFSFETVIHTEEQLNILESINLNNKLNVWLKINTGMNRLGFNMYEVDKTYNRLINNPFVFKPLRFMTHFSDADTPSSTKTDQQFESFQKIISNFSGETCIANSAATLIHHQMQTDWIRPGISMYGISPFIEKPITNIGFKPIMTLKSRIIAIHELNAGETVGYNSTWKATDKTKVGIVNIGYGDGYPRHIQQDTPLLFNGQRCVVIGKVAMDMLTVDLSSQPNVKVGNEVTLWGPELPIHEIATKAGTIPYELVCQLTGRVNFQYYD